jgi:hypothetical protein
MLLALSLRNHEFPDVKLGPETGYSDQAFCDVPQSFQENEDVMP